MQICVYTAVCIFLGRESTSPEIRQGAWDPEKTMCRGTKSIKSYVSPGPSLKGSPHLSSTAHLLSKKPPLRGEARGAEACLEPRPA